MAMTREEFELYEKLHDEFLDRCSTVCAKLSTVHSEYKHLDRFYLEDGEVWGEGDEYWGYGGHEHHAETFQVEFLFDDTLLDKYIGEAAERDEKQKREKEKVAKLAKDFRRQEYERLKKEFENEDN